MDNDILQELLQRVVRIETKIDDYNGLRAKLDETHHLTKYNSSRLDKLESNTTWLWRSIVGAIILGVIGTLIKFK